MVPHRLSATDLNLLVALDALVAEGNVTRAAARVGLTQPAMSHALISPRGRQGGFVDRALARQGRTRRVALTIPHFLAAPIVVAGSDLILTVPERIARAFAKMLPLQIVEPPLEVEGFAVTQYWHERQARDPAHRWFRGLVVEVSRAT